ncbi:unnamed protein product [Ixodes pacificus]
MDLGSSVVFEVPATCLPESRPNSLIAAFRKHENMIAEAAINDGPQPKARPQPRGSGWVFKQTRTAREWLLLRYQQQKRQKVSRHGGDGLKMPAIKYNVDDWVEANKTFFVPPVCNKMMHHQGQLKVFYVGGPNVRRDYHIEEGEEFFYMLRGDMVLKVLERGRAKDVVIREGQVFLLPGRIAHSPQRLADTVGLVVERERASHEQDCLRFYTDDTCSQVLHERWVYCKDLYLDLVPLINEFLGSEQCRTNRPGPGSFLGKPAYAENTETTLSPPFDLNQWLQRHDNLLSQPNAKRDLFEGKHQTKALVLGNGTHGSQCENTETFLWQRVGSAKVDVQGTKYVLAPNETLLVHEPGLFTLINDVQGRTVALSMPPK